MEINNQYDFFKNVKLDDDGNLLVSLNGGSDLNVNLGPVLDNTVSNPSTLTPNDGDRYIVASGATGAWSANTNSIAQWSDVDAEWVYYIPINGDRTIVTTGVNAGKIYEFNGTSWGEIVPPVTSSTPFFLAGTSIDAGSDKTSRISRTGDVVIGDGPVGINTKLTVNGSSLSSTYATRYGYAGTNDITRTGNWFRIMSFDCNYSIFATDHYKFMLAFNGNSDGAGFVAEMDVLIKRQNTSIFTNVVIKQSKTNTELVYDISDKNIEFLWNNTTKQITMYFRPDLNYSQLSFTILTPRTGINRFAFLNQYIGATDLSGEVSDVFTEKFITIGETIGNDGGVVFDRTKLSDVSTGEFSSAVQSPFLHLNYVADGVSQFSTQQQQTQTQITKVLTDAMNNLSATDNMYITNGIRSWEDYTNNETSYFNQGPNNITFYVQRADIPIGVNVTHDIANYEINVFDNDVFKGTTLNATSDSLMLKNSSDSDALQTTTVYTNGNIESTVLDTTGIDTVRMRTNQAKDYFTLRFEDLGAGIDKTIQFGKTEMYLPDGYNIESSYQPDADVNTFISVGDGNLQGQAILLNTVNSSTGNNSFIFVETNNINISSSGPVVISSTVDQHIVLSDLLVYANDAAADADVSLPSGALYKLTGNRTVFQKP